MGGISIDADALVILVLPLWLVSRLIRVYLLKKKGQFKYRREVLLNLFFVYILMAVTMVLFPVVIIYDSSELLYNNRINLIPVVKAFDLFKGGHGIAWIFAFKNIFGNLLLLFPLGLILPALYNKFNKVKVITVIGFSTSLVIETLQYLESFIGNSSRISDIDDIILNTIGAALGYLVFSRLTVKSDYLITDLQLGNKDI